MSHPAFTPLQVQHPAQPYAGVAARLAQSELGATVPALLARVYDWLAAQQRAVTGAALIRYLEVQPDGALLVHVGFPVTDAPLAAPAPFVSAVLPAGTYVTVVHRGAYEGLATTTAQLLEWGRAHGVPWEQPGPARWSARVEHYLVGPPAESRSAHWHTEVAILRKSPA